MPKKTHVLLTFLLFSYFHVFSQEEFFGSHNGISTSYLNGLGGGFSKANGGGTSFCFKNGFIPSIGFINDSKMILPTVGFSYLILNAGFGFGYTPFYNLFQFSFGTYKVLFKQKSFPGILSGDISISLIPKSNSKEVYNIPPIIGISYIQAFFARNRLYPVAGIIYDHDFDNHQMFSAVIGLNLRLGRL